MFARNSTQTFILFKMCMIHKLYKKNLFSDYI